MPGVYRLKNCPNCDKEHRKRGPFCSQGCHNSYREVSDRQRENGKQMGENNAGDPALIAAGHMLQRGQMLSADEYGVEIPDIPDLIDLPDGYEKGENW